VPNIYLLQVEESAVDQGEEVFGLLFCLLPFLRRIRARGGGQ
jgi:hypothetical protein